MKKEHVLETRIAVRPKEPMGKGGGGRLGVTVAPLFVHPFSPLPILLSTLTAPSRTSCTCGNFNVLYSHKRAAMPFFLGALQKWSEPKLVSAQIRLLMLLLMLFQLNLQNHSVREPFGPDCDFFLSLWVLCSSNPVVRNPETCSCSCCFPTIIDFRPQLFRFSMSGKGDGSLKNNVKDVEGLSELLDDALKGFSEWALLWWLSLYALYSWYLLEWFPKQLS